MTPYTTPGQAAFDAHYSEMVPHLERSDGGHWDDVAQAAINAQWIPCSERMPEIDVQEVLAWVGGCPYPVVAVRRVGAWTEEPWFSSCSVSSEHEMDVIIPENLVTHWMPLPQPPEVTP